MGSFGRALRELRRGAKLTQRQLAEKTKLDFSYISKLENGKLPPPSADTIVRMSQVLGVPAEHLLALTQKIPSRVQRAVSTSEAAQRFLQEAGQLSLSDDEWEAMLKSLRRLKGGR